MLQEFFFNIWIAGARDPGIRVAASGFGSNGVAHQFLHSRHHDGIMLMRAGQRIDRLQGRMMARDENKQLLCSHSRRWTMRKAKQRMWNVILNQKRDAHAKYVANVSASYGVWLEPKFSPSHFVPRKGRILAKDTIKALLHWSQFALRQRMLDKAKRDVNFLCLEVSVCL